MKRLSRVVVVFFLFFCCEVVLSPVFAYLSCPGDWHVEDAYADSFAPAYVDVVEVCDGASSVRMERGDGSKGREVNGYNVSDDDGWFYVGVGELVVFDIYMKTGDSSINDLTTTAGVRFGVLLRFHCVEFGCLWSFWMSR